MAINLNHPTNTIDGTGVLNVNSGDGENIELNPDSGLVNVNGNINIAGNFTVQGTTTTINSTTSSIVDPIILLGTDENGDPAVTVDSKDRGVAFYYNDGAGNKTGFFGYDRGTGYFRFVPDSTITGEIVSGSDGVIKIDTLESTTINTVNLNVSNDANVTGDLIVGGHVIVPTTEIGDLNFSTNTISSDTSGDIVLDPGSNDIDVSNSTIKNLLDPVNLQDAATKNYVDTAINDNTNLDIAADAGTGTINLATETLTINGTTFQVETSVVGNVITITLPTTMTVPGSLNVVTDLVVSGNSSVNGNLNVLGDTDIDGNLNVDGNITLGGNITIGDQTLDTITVIADFTSNLTPDIDSTYDIGETSKRWRTIYADNISSDNIVSTSSEIGDLNFSTNTITSDLTGDIVLDPGSDSVDVSNSLIKNVLDPVNSQDAATKNYVDSAINSNTNLNIAADSGTGEINLATETFTINGTSDQIVTGTSGNTTTISLPSSLIVPGSLNVTTDFIVTGSTTLNSTLSAGASTLSSLQVTNNTSLGGTLTATGNSVFQNDVTVQGSLNVLGTLTSINTVDTEIKDNYITLNQGETGDGVSAGFSGFEIDRGTAVDGNALLQWNESNDFWEFGVGTSYANLAAYNLYLAGGATVDGAVSIGSLEVEDLTEGRIVFVGVGGELVDSSQLTFTGTGLHIEKNLYVNSGNNIIATGNADITGEVTAANVTVTTLTEDRIPFANQDSRLVDSPSLTFDLVTALFSVPNISASNEISAGTIKDANLTAGRVVFSGSSGELIDNFYFTFDNSSTALTIDDITIDDGSIVFGNAANIITNDGNITLNAGANNISASSSRIINIADPVNPQDAATKTWVETTVNNNANLSIAGTNGSGIVNLATETFTVAGTTNQIATLAAGQSVTVSLPNTVITPGSLSVTSTLDVTGHTNVSTIIGSGAATLDSLSVTNDLDVLGSTIIYGNLTVQGTTTSVQSVDTVISDNIITLNDGETGSGVSSGYSGVLVDRGTEPDTVFQWNELLDRWEIKEGSDLTYFAASGVDAGDLNISGNTITSTQPNGDVLINSTGTGQVIVNGEPVVTGLDSIVYAIVFGG